MSLAFDLSWHCGDFKLAVEAEWPDDHIIAVCGPSGCGKTSFARCLAGFNDGVQGQLRFGSAIWLAASRQSVPAHLRHIGFVFQHGALFEHLNVHDNIAYGLRRLHGRQPLASIAELSERCGLTSLLERGVKGLSGGERQRVALARALITKPQLMILDEPLANLDQTSKQQLLPLIHELRQQWHIPVVYISHHVDEVAMLADQVVSMHAGRFVKTSTVSEFVLDADNKLLGSEQAQVYIDADVHSYDSDLKVLELSFPGGRLRIIAREQPKAKRQRVRVYAKDVSISLVEPMGTSIMNVLRCRIASLQPLDDGRVLVRLDCHGQCLLARISMASSRQLRLETGMEVYAQVKALALSACPLGVQFRVGSFL